MNIVATKGLSKHYGRRVGLAQVSLTLEEGSVCGFLGPNGVGKTTTIRLLLGFLWPTRGSASIFGMDCWRQGHRVREDIGYVPGDLRLYSWMTSRRALELFGHSSRIRASLFPSRRVILYHMPYGTRVKPSHRPHRPHRPGRPDVRASGG